MQKAFTTLFLLALLTSVPVQGRSGYEIPHPKPLSGKGDTLTVFIIGDVMMHERQFGFDHRQFLEKISHRMREADICAANMEFTLAGSPYSGYPAFSCPEYMAEYVAGECGADILLTANNHILDKGQKGLARTLEIYSSLGDSLGTRYAGSARSEAEREGNFPLFIRKKGFRIAFINCTYGTNAVSHEGWPKTEYMERKNLAEAFLKAREADFTIALPHWGDEYKLRHSASQEEWAQWMVEQGADAIVGAHPHVVQDTTHINGVPVIYSIGNAVSNMSAENTRLELAVTLRFVSDPVSGEKTMLEPELHFLWCCLPGRLTDSYSTIFIKEWSGRRSDWLIPGDYDNMIETLRRVRSATGISRNTL